MCLMREQESRGKSVVACLALVSLSDRFIHLVTQNVTKDCHAKQQEKVHT